MASYEYWEYGKSRNAVAAEDNQKYTATCLARLLNCTPRAIKELKTFSLYISKQE